MYTDVRAKQTIVISDFYIEKSNGIKWFDCIGSLSKYVFVNQNKIVWHQQNPRQIPFIAKKENINWEEGNLKPYTELDFLQSDCIKKENIRRTKKQSRLKELADSG